MPDHAPSPISLTIEQKVALLAGADNWHTVAMPGVPSMRFSDGPAGVRGTSWTGPRSASFPCATALAAGFDLELAAAVGESLAREARSKGAHVLLGPTVNLHRTPVGGRNFECFSEDPVLTARIAVAYVRGLQRSRVAACVKHFVANDTEFERATISSEVDERTLRELYLAPFEAVVAAVEAGGGGARAVMSAYNRVNGTFASEHPWLLRSVLRDEWGFDGLVISDWHGTHSGAGSLEAGLDLEMPGPARRRGPALLADVRAGAVSSRRVDESVRRLVELAAWTGAGDPPDGERTDDAPATRAVIRAAAIAGTVLLKNEGPLLPIGPADVVALLGPNARRGQLQGGGSAQVRPNRPVGPLAALRGRGVRVLHAEGCSIAKRLPPLDGDFTIHYTGGDGAEAVAPMPRVEVMWMDEPAPGIDIAHFGAVVAGSFLPDTSGEWTFGLSAVGGATVWVDGTLVCDLGTAQTGGSFFGFGSPEVRGTVQLRAGVPSRVEVQCDLMRHENVRGLLVGARGPAVADDLEHAVGLAAAASVAVVVVGTDDDWETEGEDRQSLRLPGRQDELVARVAAVNPRTVVVVNAGSPVAMPWLDAVAAVVQVWFPGAEMGEALADVLLGVAEPGGRLPVTIPRALADTPAYGHHPGREGRAVYGEGLLIGHRWYDAHGIEPLFPFGHGLGYTTFRLDDAEVSGSVADGLLVRVAVTNTGSRFGSEVVQCYVQPPAGDPARPLRTLQGFAKVRLHPGDTAVAEIALDRRAFSSWDVERGRFAVTEGEHLVLVGTSSRSLDRGTAVRAG